MLSICSQNMRLLRFVSVAIVLTLVIEQAAALEPWVRVAGGGLDPNGYNISIHVPALFDMKLLTRNGLGFKLEQSSFLGLQSLHMDRIRKAPGARHNGPVRVKVLGMTMYENGDADENSKRSQGSLSSFFQRVPYDAFPPQYEYE